MLESGKSPVVREQHFVPRHYLRQFGYPGTERISLARIDPFKYAINASIGDQCKEDYFYGEDGEVDKLMQIAENDLAPALRTVCCGNSFDYQHLNALTVLTVLLRLRTRKAAKEAGLIPQREFYEVTQAGIDAGHIPAPKGGWTRDMVDVEGASGLLIGFTIECWMELFTLTPKLLLAPASAVFVTSDHPVILLNQFAEGADPLRSFCGFTQSGLQILLPLSSGHCLFLFDPATYQVPNNPGQVINLSQAEVETINALQIQSAERCIYFNDTVPESVAKNLVENYRGLRVPIEDSLRVYPGANSDEEIRHLREPTLKVVGPWSFCRPVPHPPVRPGDRRNPRYSAGIERFVEEREQGWLQGDFWPRFQKILAEM